MLLEESRASSASSATCRSRPTRSTARSRRARSPSRARSTRPPLLGLQDRRRPARAAPTATPTACDALICRASNNYGPYQYPEKLIPLCILNALHGDPLPVYGDGMQVRNWLHVERPLPRHRPRAASGQGRRGLQHRRARRAAEHRGRATDPRADRSRRVADRARHRPSRPRPPLLARLGEDRGARLAAARSASRRASRRPSSGTRTTAGGGSRSARATTASTTSASTGTQLRMS